MPLFRRDQNDDRDDPNDQSIERGGETYWGDDDRGRCRSPANATVVDGDPRGTLKRAVDREAGVVVYAYKNGNAGGPAAVPASQTDLTFESDRRHDDADRDYDDTDQGHDDA